ncbi:MAG TPA: diguanylate cyclase [Xanthomonadaceae bacterium]
MGTPFPRRSERGRVVESLRSLCHRWACAATLAFAFACVGPAFALDPNVPFQHYRFDHWGPDEGLPQISVATLAQDRLGYLWVGTQNGIARFDGNRFTLYDRDSSGVDTTLPTSSLATADGRVWFGTPRGVLWIGGERVREVGNDGALVSVLDLTQDIRERILAASESGVYVVEGDRLRLDPEIKGPAYSFEHDGAIVWVGGLGAVTRLEENHVERIPLPDPSLKVLRIVQEGDLLWLGTPAGLKWMDLRTHTLIDVPQAGDEPIGSLLLDTNGNLWVGTVNHLRRRHPDGQWETVDDGDLFSQAWIDALYEDREGDLWLGSRVQSLVRLRDSAISRIGAREGMADPFTWCLLRDRDGSLLLGTSHGLVAVDKDGKPGVAVGAESLRSAQVYSLDEDPDGSLWIGTRGGGLALRRDGVVAMPPALAPLAGHQVDAVQHVGDDHWIATLDGLFRYRGGVLKAIGPHDGSAAAKVRTILARSHDDILVGTEAGIFHVQGETLARLPGAQALDATFVTRMAWLKPGLLAIATMDRGLGLWRDGHLLLLGKEQGLPTRNGWTLDVIGDYLYVASIDGVYRVALADLPDPSARAPSQIRTQVIVDGSQHGAGGHRYGCCNGGGDARTLREGPVLWVASSAGVVRLDTTALPAPAAPPAAVIERVSNGGVDYPGGAPLDLAGDNRDIEIGYTGLSLVDSARLEFRYRLDGYDTGWREAGARRVAYYTHLPPGDYSFKVQARPPLGAWGVGIAPLPIHIAPHWYERTAVRLLALVALVVLAAFWVMRHNAGLRRRARELQHAVDERTQELVVANARLEELSRTDSLTGLANRRAIDTAAHTSARDWTGAVLMIDLDHFKHVNDEHGHARGDEVLVVLGEILRANTRSGDRVLRWGGEEFLIVSHRLDIDAALLLAERIRDALASRRFRGHDSASIRITCSVGIASLPVHPRRVGDLDASIALADFALYRAKSEGRDRARAVILPPDASTGISQGDLREEVERLDARGGLIWRTASVHPPG